MDPNAALTRIRELVTVTLAEEGDVGPYVTAELAELIDGLDSALSAGMFLPEPWAVNGDFTRRMAGKACSTCGTWHSRCP